MASVKRALRMVPPASAEPTLGVIACKRSNRVAGGGCSSAAAVGPTMCGPSTREPPRPFASGSSSSPRQFWLVRASLSKSACRGPEPRSDGAKIRRLAGKSKLVAAAGTSLANSYRSVRPRLARGWQGPLRPKGCEETRPSAAPNAALSAGAFRTSRRASWDGWLGQATRTGMALNFVVFRHDGMVEPAMNCWLRCCCTGRTRSSRSSASSTSPTVCTQSRPILYSLTRRRCYARHGVDRPASRHAGAALLLPRLSKRSMEAQPCSSQ